MRPSFLLLSFLLVSCAPSPTTSLQKPANQMQAVYNGRYCNSNGKQGHFPYEIYRQGWPLGSKNPTSLTYYINEINYICVDNGEVLVDTNWTILVADESTEDVYLSVSYMGLDWPYVDEVLIEADNFKLQRRANPTRGESTEGFPIEHIFIYLSPQELWTIVHAESVRVSYGEVNPITFSFPAQLLFNLEQFTEYVAEQHQLTF